MKNFVKPGHTLTLTAPAGGVISGNGYLIGALFVVASFSAAAGELFEGRPEGCYRIAAATGAGTDITEGALVYWDNTAKNVTKTSAGNTLIGHCIAAKATADTTVLVRLQP